MSILITGANGYVGRSVVSGLQATGNDDLVLWLHAANAEEFEAKKGARPDSAGIAYAWGDLTAAEPFSGVDASRITKIIHSAAVTRFNVEEGLARQVNTEGTAKTVAFAKTCAKLERFSLIGTVYASGLAQGRIPEEMIGTRPKFSNFYEQSKFDAEQAVAASGLPWNIVRVATIIADDDTGHVTQYNAFHNTLKLVFYGLISLLPGNPETPVYFVRGKDVARAILSLLDKDGVYHICDEKTQAIRLGRLIDIAFEEFQKDADFKARRILKPLYSDQRSFETLVEGLDSFAGDIVNQSIRSVAPFASQLFIHKEFLNSRMREACPWYAPPDMEALIRRTCETLVRTRWGRQ